MPTVLQLTIVSVLFFPLQASPAAEEQSWEDAPAEDPFAGAAVAEDPFNGERLSWELSDPPMPLPSSRQSKTPLEVGDPLAIAIRFSNTSSRTQRLPRLWFKDATHGGPAIMNAVSLSLKWSPFDPGYPTQRDYVELVPTRTAQFEPDATTRTLKPRESCELLALDFRDWFKVEREGHYLICVKIDWESLGIRNEMTLSRERRSAFDIGKPPKLPTIEEYNKTVPIFGGSAGERRLKRLIEETVKPKPMSHKRISAELKQLLAWSEPVAGLSARIEYMRECRYWSGGECFVRLKNVSDRTLVVPMGNPCDEDAAPLFDLYVQHGAGPWRHVVGGHDGFIAAPSDPEAELRELPVTDRPWATLKPGEDCVAVFWAWNEEDCVVASRAKVVLTQPDRSVPGKWSGNLETPSRVLKPSPEQLLARRRALPFLDHFPSLSYDISGYPSAPSSVTDVDFLDYGNWAFTNLLALYEPEGICREFERRMQAERVLPMKLLLASIAAPAGSEEAALFLLEMTKETGYVAVANTRYALSLTCERYPSDPPDWESDLPDWLVELCLAASSDRRFITDFEGAGFSSEPHEISSCVQSPMEGLLGSRCRKAVPTLIDWAKNGQSEATWALGEIGGQQAIAALTEMADAEPVREDAIDALCYTRDQRAVPALVSILEEAATTGIEERHNQPIRGLGQIGDERAIPVLLKLLEKVDESDVTMESGRLQPPLSALAHTLTYLNAKEAVSQLLRFVQYPEIIECLANIGDPVALPTLREIVAAEGRLTRNGNAVSPELEADRYYAARMALCTWDDDRGAARLLDMLGDKETAENRRHDIVKALGRSKHPKAIPALVAVVTSARGRESIRAAISALGELKYKAAAKGLIECFDADFKEEHWGKGRQVTPATYHNDIARSLQSITGRSFGNDKIQWRQWWQQEGRYATELK